MISKLSPLFTALMLTAILLLLSGCSFFADRYSVKTEQGKVKTLADIINEKQTASNEQNSIEIMLDRLDPKDISQSYQRAFELIDDPLSKIHIMQRLAAIDLQTAENMDIAGLIGTEEAYHTAVVAYTTLLENLNADSEKERSLQGDKRQVTKDQLLYALSKAYSLKGDADLSYDRLTQLVEEFPSSEYWLEAQFRRGEYLFSKNDFVGSAKAYAELLAKEPTETSAELFSNAKYMAGWSEFKNSRYTVAIDYFTALIEEKLNRKRSDTDNLFDDDQQIFVVDYVLGTEAFEQKDKIMDDALRAIVFCFAYQPLKELKVNLSNKLRDKQYSYWVYAGLAELFFKQERFADAATIYGLFVTENPQLALSPWFHRQQIAVMQHAKFVEQARSEKERFANLYHPQTEYYKQVFGEINASSESSKAYVDNHLAIYLDELASFYHAKGRLLLEQGDELDDEAFAAFDFASYWYQQKILAYPNALTVASTYYLLGDSFSESRRWSKAIDAYETAAYEYIDTSVTGNSNGLFIKANEAGYAALLSYNQYIDQLTNESALSERWRHQKIKSALKFTRYFQSDSRRHQVLADTVKELQILNEWPRLITVADKLLFVEGESVSEKLARKSQRQPNLNGNLRLLIPTWLASAEAAFSLGNYAEAEYRYRFAISSMEPAEPSKIAQAEFLREMSDKELDTTKENYASSIYKQAEMAMDSGDPNAAIQHFRRLVNIMPNSDLGISAQRNVIILLTNQQRWSDVKIAVNKFLKELPLHPEKLDMQRRLLKAQVLTEDWINASALAVTISDSLLAEESSADSSVEKNALKNTVRQEAKDLLYAAAEYAENAGDKSLAIERYKRITSDGKNIDERQYEAHYKLASLYFDTNNSPAQFNQYRKIRDLEPTYAKRSARSLFIVADAASQLAELDYRAYKGLSITAPLQKSLQIKQTALEKAVAAYNRIENYSVQKYALLATQRKAQIYADFATALIQSERPKGLEELALEEYEILLEDQAYPFEEKAVALYEVNVKRAWRGMKSRAINDSYAALAELLPARYHKPEILE